MLDDLGALPLFAGLDDAQRRVIGTVALDVHFAAGRRMLVDGQETRAWWLIRSGSVALDTTVPGRTLTRGATPPNV